MAQPVITYQTPHQEMMLENLSNRYLPEFMETILSVERDSAPSPRISRLLSGDDSLEPECLSLLGQRKTKELSAILMNELPQQGHSLRQPNARKQPVDPVIYINYIVNGDKTGFSLDKYERLLAGVALSLGVEFQEFPELIDVHNFDSDEMKRRINVQYQSQTGKHRSFFDSISASLYDQAPAWLRYHLKTVLPAARLQQRRIDGEVYPVTHIMLPGEVGLATCGYQRCMAHANIAPVSPHLFRLVQLVAKALWPGDQWQLHQVYVFELLGFSQTPIGESLASTLCGSYASFGGFNFTQAGISASGPLSMGEDDWTGAIINVRDSKTWENIKDNLKEGEKVIRHMEEAADRKRRRRQYRELDAKNVRLCQEISTKLKEIERRWSQLDVRLESVQHEDETRREVEEGEIEAGKAVRSLWKDVEDG